MKRILFVICAMFVLCSCGHSTKCNKDHAKHHGKTHDGNHGGYTTDVLTAGLLWMYTSAEYRALSYQSYNHATEIVKDQLKVKSKKPKAIILDLDETVIDNLAYNAKNILIKKDYDPKTWKSWSEKELASLIPGAKDFLDFARKNKVEIFYITNRGIDENQNTISNLKKIGIPVEPKNLLARNPAEGSSKKGRRAIVEENYRVILYVGDNMGDFHESFEKKSVDDRLVVTENYKKDYGTKYIILPNPIYGDWMSAIHKTCKEKFGEKDFCPRKCYGLFLSKSANDW